MMTKTREKMQEKSDVLNINLDAGIGRELMRGGEWPWMYFWSQAETQLRELEMLRLKKLAEVSKGKSTSKEMKLTREWTRGDDYSAIDKDRKAKSRAMNSVIAELEIATDKNLTRAESILSEVTSELCAKHGLDESAAAPSTELSWSKQMVDSASAALRFLSKTASKSSVRLLTGIVAILVPKTVLDRVGKPDESGSWSSDELTKTKFCDLLGINRRAKYITSAIQNRLAFNKLAAKTGDIDVGEKVVCRGGTGELLKKNDDDSVTVKLLPWGNVKTYKTTSSAQLRRVIPELDSYDRTQRSDVTPASHKKTIEEFFLNVVPRSPSKRDTVKLRHPEWPRNGYWVC